MLGFLKNLPIPRRLLWSIWDRRLEVVLPVKQGGREAFKIYDYGEMTRYRASTFDAKEPETNRWIASFKQGEKLLDIGANIGIYSLYAATRGIDVVSIEPDSLNYALLNLNIRINDFGGRITPYLVAAHDVSKFSSFNISSCEWGGALNSFDNALDAWGETYKPVHSQGVYGISLDDFLPQVDFCPDHIKVDVDGNEILILRGAFNSLRSARLQSVLIELDESRADYDEAIALIEQAGFSLQEKTHSPVVGQGKYSTLFNHIFVRLP